AGPCALSRDEIVRVGDHGGRRRSTAADADLQRRVQGRLVRKLLKLIALPFDRAREQNERRRPDQRDERDGDEQHHLAGLGTTVCHQYSSRITVCESNVTTEGMPRNLAITGCHLSFRSTTASWWPEVLTAAPLAAAQLGQLHRGLGLPAVESSSYMKT